MERPTEAVNELRTDSVEVDEYYIVLHSIPRHELRYHDGRSVTEAVKRIEVRSSPPAVD